MGYCIEQRDSNFKVNKENQDKALNALKNLVNREELCCITKTIVLQSTTLKEALYECRYDCHLDDDGNIDKISFIGEKMGSDDYVFNTIAPFVEDNSFIEMQGEEGELWRWIFKHGRMTEKYATINWD